MTWDGMFSSVVPMEGLSMPQSMPPTSIITILHPHYLRLCHWNNPPHMMMWQWQHTLPFIFFHFTTTMVHIPFCLPTNVNTVQQCNNDNNSPSPSSSPTLHNDVTTMAFPPVCLYMPMTMLCNDTTDPSDIHIWDLCSYVISIPYPMQHQQQQWHSDNNQHHVSHIKENASKMMWALCHQDQGIDWHPQSDFLGMFTSKVDSIELYPFISGLCHVVDDLRQLTCFLGCFRNDTNALFSQLNTVRLVWIMPMLIKIGLWRTGRR